MTIETETHARLAANGTISGLVSTRIYPLILPKSPTMPALVYHKVSGPRVHDLDGASGRALPRIQIDSWADTYTGAQALAAAVRGSLDGYNGLLTTIRATFKLDNEIDDYEEDTKLYRVIQDYIISHTEA